MPVILVVSHSEDIHVDFVSSLLTGNNIQVFQLEVDCFPRDYSFWCSYTSSGIEGEIRHLTSDVAIRLEDIAAVWLRKPADFSFLDLDLAEQEIAYAVEETEHTLLGLLYSLNCFWISHPLCLRSAMWKLEQLNRAVSFGFAIPKSLITNMPSKVKVLAATNPDGIIFKALSSSWLCADKVEPDKQLCTGLATTLLTEQDLSDLSSVSKLPCHFQNYVKKDYELRVTVVGDKLFAARINSQNDPHTEVDCRKLNTNVSYSKYELPDDWARRILAFIQSYSLAYSALDFIVTTDKELIFLENNPNGQFLYIEQLVPELKLCQAVADLLLENVDVKTGH